MNLLSVDWDFFFPEPKLSDPESLMFDWGHHEAPFFIDSAWHHRAAAFLRHGMPLPGLSGEQEGFWSRFRFSPKAELIWAESHSNIGLPEVEQGVARVWSYDAHHDAGYGKLSDLLPNLSRGMIHCDDWALFYTMTKASRFHRRSRDIRVVYPRWKSWAMEAEIQPAWPVSRAVDDGKVLRPVIHRVFVCRSGAWVPSWLDAEWWSFLRACPIENRRGVGYWVDREFHLSRAQQEADETTELLNRLDSRETGT